MEIAVAIHTAMWASIKSLGTENCLIYFCVTNMVSLGMLAYTESPSSCLPPQSLCCCELRYLQPPSKLRCRALTHQTFPLPPNTHKVGTNLLSVRKRDVGKTIFSHHPCGSCVNPAMARSQATLGATCRGAPAVLTRKVF